MRAVVPMRVISLLYHDVIPPGDYESSGMPGAAAARYKLDLAVFREHLRHLSQAVLQAPGNVLHLLGDPNKSAPFLLTFDDGGSSSQLIAELLEEIGWRGHFFIVTDFVGKRGFLDATAIRELHRRGHVIGSHSCSHPRLSACDWPMMLDEWKRSCKQLSNTVGETVTVASVPGGFYSRQVGESADAAGIRALFTSEPTASTWAAGRCLVLGRYTLRRGDAAERAASVARGDWLPRISQLFAWNIRKLPKTVAPQFYERLKRRLIRTEAGNN